MEPLINGETRRVLIHLSSDEEIVESLSLELTPDQELDLFQTNLHFLQGSEEKSMIQFVETKLKESFNQRSSSLQMENELMDSMKKLLNDYANRRLSSYSREQCLQIGVEYGFDDLFDQLDSEEFQTNKERKQIHLMVDDIQRRLKLKIERRLVGEKI